MTVTIEVPVDQELLLNEKARAVGVPVEEYVRQVLAQDLEPAPPARHIAEVFRENMSRVPAEILDALPADGASEHDRYIYGLPNQTP